MFISNDNNFNNYIKFCNWNLFHEKCFSKILNFSHQHIKLHVFPEYLHVYSLKMLAHFECQITFVKNLGATENVKSFRGFR